MIVSYGRKNIGWSDNNSHLRNMRKVFVHEIMSNKNLEASSTFRRTEVRKTIKHLFENMSTEVDIGGMAFLTSLRIITNVLWGSSLVEDEKIRNLGIEFREVVIETVRLLGAPNLSDFFPVLSRLDLQGVERQMKLAWEKIDRIFERIIEERITGKPEDGVEQHGRKDFLQILLELKEQKVSTSLDITQIKALLLDIVVAATDTTATLIEWITAELLQNQKEMHKVQDELKQVVGLNNIVEEYHLPKLQHLDAVIKETLRFLSHDGATNFDFNGYNSTFMPFGSGRRMCPGVPMGEKMLVYLMASMLHSFDWTLPFDKTHELSGKFSFMLKKREPLIAIPSQRLPYKTLYM
ncbi:hypothetical protein L1987_17734 [Smallanthus sonchifolius]|uniref:Uncharacterized protein n=1 Tax=Smallanthus sonchifolius TaxID=185202 RepID=A0ACB9IYT4_9ASTR|nr:hypothetical protein L1987_17734 [Smallanthus sonchifolius]